MDRPWLDDAERELLSLASVELETGMGGIWIYAGTEVGLTRVPDCFCRWQDVQRLAVTGGVSLGGSGATLQVYNATQPFTDRSPALKWDGEGHITIEVG